MYRFAIRRLTGRVPSRPSPPNSLLARGLSGAPFSTNATAPRNIVRLVLSLRLGSAARYYATRSRGTQTGSTKPKSSRKATPAKKSPTKKAAKKPKKKAAAKKPKPRKAATPEQQLVAKVKLLKQQALLNEPKYKPISVWQILVAEPGVGSGVSSEAIASRKNRYASLAASERQTYQTEADANKRSNAIIKKQFVESHTPYEVRRANVARAALSRYAKQPPPPGRKRALVAKKQYLALPDERVPKRPLGSFFQFCQDQRQNGSLESVGVAEQSREAKRQWQGLSQGEKKRYTDVYAFQREEYSRKIKALMPEQPQRKTRSSAAAA